MIALIALILFNSHNTMVTSLQIIIVYNLLPWHYAICSHNSYDCFHLTLTSMIAEATHCKKDKTGNDNVSIILQYHYVVQLSFCKYSEYTLVKYRADYMHVHTTSYTLRQTKNPRFSCTAQTTNTGCPTIKCNWLLEMVNQGTTVEIVRLAVHEITILPLQYNRQQVN